jgi:hypothetical protein
MAIEQLSKDLSLFTFDNGTAALLSFSDSRQVSIGSCQKISYRGSAKGGEQIRYWGKKNDLPQFREQVVGDNNIVGSLIQTKRDIYTGTGLYAYRVDFKSDGGKRNITEVQIPDEAQEFFDRVDIDGYHLDAAKDLIFHSNIFTEFVRTKGGDIHSMKISECKYTRLGEQNKRGIVEHAYISGAWALSGEHQKDGMTDFDREVIRVPLYNPEGKGQPKFILHTGDRLFNDGYYNSPSWWGSLNWIELANNIPIFHRSNIMNGYTIRFHIQIPKNYFKQPVQGVDPSADALKKANDEEARRRSEFMENMNSMLSGMMKAGRAIFTTYDIIEAMGGKEMPGIKIDPITVDIKDEALLKLFEKSITAVATAQNLHPTMANYDTAGKLSSGSEMRNAYNMYLATKTITPRRILLQALNLVKKINKWDPDIHFGFGDTELVTLDENPSGKEEDVATTPDE